AGRGERGAARRAPPHARGDRQGARGHGLRRAGRGRVARGRASPCAARARRADASPRARAPRTHPARGGRGDATHSGRLRGGAAPSGRPARAHRRARRRVLFGRGCATGHEPHQVAPRGCCATPLARARTRGRAPGRRGARSARLPYRRVGERDPQAARRARRGRGGRACRARSPPAGSRSAHRGVGRAPAHLITNSERFSSQLSGEGFVVGTTNVRSHERDDGDRGILHQRALEGRELALARVDRGGLPARPRRTARRERSRPSSRRRARLERLHARDRGRDPALVERAEYAGGVSKVAPLPYDDRTVYSVASFNRGVAQWLGRLPTVWVEGEVTELKRHARWASVFFTLKDPDDGSCVAVQMPRGQFDALRLDLADGERVHVYGRPELFAQRGDFRLRALTGERFGVGAHLAALERLKQTLAAEGLFADERKRPLPLLPRRIGLVTGNDAAAKRDVIATIQSRFPAARVLVAETYVKGPRAAVGVVEALERLCAEPDVDVIVLTRGGGSFEDLLPFSDERLVRAVAGCRVPVVSAVGHEQDTPLCDLAADRRASTPTAAGKLVVPELSQLSEGLDRARHALARCVRRTLERDAERLERTATRLRTAPQRSLERQRESIERVRERLGRAPALAIERKRAALESSAGRLRVLSPQKTLQR